MNRVREIIEESLNSIRERLQQNLFSNEPFWVGLEDYILLLQNISNEILECDDSLLSEIENTRQIIQRRNNHL